MVCSLHHETRGLPVVEVGGVTQPARHPASPPWLQGQQSPEWHPRDHRLPVRSSQAWQHESVHLIRREVIVCAHIGRTEEERRATGDLGAKSGSCDTLILEESLCCRSGHCPWDCSSLTACAALNLLEKPSLQFSGLKK